MATVIMALLYVLEGAILTVTAVVTGINILNFQMSGSGTMCVTQWKVKKNGTMRM